MSGADRLHRGVLLFIGLVILAAGLGGLFAGTGVLGHAIEHQHLYSSRTSRFVGQHGNWVWPLAAVVSIVIALLALRWLKAQGTSPKTRTVRIPSRLKQGRTTVEGGALTSAITREIESYRGVRAAHARLMGDSHTPRLQLSVIVDNTVRLSEMRMRIDAQAIARARAALAPVPLSTVIDYDVSTKAPRRA